MWRHVRTGRLSLDDRSLLRLVYVLSGLLVASAAALAVYIYVDSTRSRDTALDRELSQLESQIGREPGDIQLRLMVAEAYLQKGWNDKAIAQAGQVLKADEGQDDALTILGLAYQREGDLDHAVPYLEQVVRQNEGNEMTSLNQNLLRANYVLGEIYLAKGDPERAAVALQRVLAADATDADALRLLGDALAVQGHTDEAVASYRRALRFVPDYREAYEGLARIWKTQGDSNRAAVAEGMLSLDQGKLAAAESSLTRAAKNLPDMIEAQIGLGMLYEKLGQRAQAIQAYQRALSLDQSSYVAKQALSRLQSR